MRDSTIIYRSFYEAIRDLPKENQANLWNAIFEYSLDGKYSELEGIDKTVFTLIKPQLDANTKRYENGKKGGRPKKEDNPEITKEEPNDNQSETKPEANVNDNLNDNLNDNKNDSEIKKTPAQICKEFFSHTEKQNEITLKISEDKNIPIDSAQNEVNKFVSYWTEKNKSGTKQRWETQKTFEVPRRLSTWFGNVNTFSPAQTGLDVI